MLSFLSQHQTSVSYSIDVSSEHLWEINELISKMAESSFTYTQSFSLGNLCRDRIANYRCTNSSMLVVKTSLFLNVVRATFYMQIIAYLCFMVTFLGRILFLWIPQRRPFPRGFELLIPLGDAERQKGASVDFLVHWLNSPVKGWRPRQPAQNPESSSNNNSSTLGTVASVLLI